MMARVIKSVLLFLICMLPFTAMSYDPCDEIPLIYSCPSHDELWNGSSISRTTDCLCPPYNKTDRSGCLKQFDLAGPFNIIYNRYCAEESPSTDFFAPKIHVRVQTCNFGCWTLSDNLRGDGECAIYPGSFGIPLLRLCARIALPDDPLTQTSADDGYTYGWHLNYEGAPEADPVYDGDDGKPVYMARPKVCAYWDPSFWDALANYVGMAFGGGFAILALLSSGADAAGVTPSMVQEFIASTGTSTTGLAATDTGTAVLRGLQANLQPDFWDLNPVNQSSHFHQGGIFIIFQWIISLFKMGLSGANLLKSLVGMIPGDSIWYAYIVAGVYWLLVAIIYIGEEIIVPVLEYLGQVNNVVAAALGCVLVPLGPNPPPYCNPLAPAPSIPKVTQVCPTIYDWVQDTSTSNYSLQTVTVPSTSRNKCVNSSQPNNVIHNTVRIGFDHLIPLCDSTQQPSDKCVRIRDLNLAPSSLHVRTNQLDIITKICSSTTPAATEFPCIESPNLLAKCGANTSLCGGGIRVVYATEAGTTMVNSYFDTEATDCTPLNNTMCQKIWGINTGDFRDLVVEFPAVESSYTDVAKDSASAVITDSDNSTVSVYARIVRKKVALPSLVNIDPSSIYVFDSFHSLIGSAPRPVPPKPLVFQCGASSATCTSTALNPAMIAKLRVNTYTTEGALSLATSGGNGSKINLAGFDYDTFATDAEYSTIPFSGSHSVNPTTLYGTYKNNEAPYDSQGAHPTSAVYLNGLEYYAGKYVIGGEQLCLSGYKFDDCLTGKTNTSCVLSSLVNSNFMRCSKFINSVVSPYNGISLCTPAQRSSFSQITTVNEPRVAPAVGFNIVTIYRETPTLGQYCYDYPNSATNGALCRVDTRIASRVSPLPTIPNPLGEKDFYNYDKTININGDVLAVRNKTAMEFGLCVEIPQPTCAAIDTAHASDAANKFATWTAATAGELSTGTCIAGKIKIDNTRPLQRYCLVNKSNGNTSFDTLGATDGCKDGCKLTTSNSAFTYNSATKRLSFSVPWIGEGYYNYNLSFEVPNTHAVNIFKLISLGADDSIRVKINGTQVAAAPNNTYSPGVEFGRYSASSVSNLDLKPYLVDGVNSIEINLSIKGAGYADAAIDLDINNCSSISIGAP